MKIKTHKNKGVFFLVILFVGFFLGYALSLKTQAATLEEQCIKSGGTYGIITNRCTSCPAGMVTGCGAGSVCQTQADYDLCVNDGNPAASLPGAGTGGSIYGRPLTSSGNTPAPTPTLKQFDYPLLESFPGFFSAKQTLSDLPALILAIYKFGIWTIGIAGFFMLVVGGFMYMGSAGNTSTASSARGIIADALLGIVAALGAYLILYVINPELTKINISFTKVNVTETEGTPMGPAGVCKPLASGDCSVASLTAAFGSKATEASSICNGESEGKAIPSSSDLCADGKPASWGLFQINITQHNINGLPCPTAFSGGAYTFDNHNCRVKSDAASQSLYTNCTIAAKVAAYNIAAAKSIYNQDGNSWRQWGANKRSKCFFH
jgi:hypothetical protein